MGKPVFKEQLERELGFGLWLCGSRYYGYPRDDDDEDYFAEWTAERQRALERVGFEEITQMAEDGGALYVASPLWKTLRRGNVDIWLMQASEDQCENAQRQIKEIFGLHFGKFCKTDRCRMEMLFLEGQVKVPSEDDERQFLWLCHNRALKHASDGELQCSKCRLDFGRDPIVELRAKLLASL